ncbi:MAG: hypothetical protein AAGE52_07805 [Myxococcota bacterium]
MTLRLVCAIGLLTLWSGCGGGKQCAIDTDCELRERCDENNRCVSLGGDTGPADVGVRDAGDAGEDAGVDVGVDSAPMLLGTGFVTATSTNNDVPGGANSYVVSAGFTLAPEMADECTRTDMGACTVTVCPVMMPPDAGVPDAGVAADAGTDAGTDAAVPMGPSAGSIQIMGNAALTTLVPSADGTYMPVTAPERLWDVPGTVVFRSAPVAEVPMFNEELDGPDQIVVTGPALTGIVSREMDLPFTWMETSAGEVVIRISAATPTDTRSVQCNFDPAGLSATIPAGVLQTFPMGTMASVVVTTENQTVVESGVWTTTISATASGLVGGAPAVGTFTFN